MGLSASQARLLSLTARQSNLEYEGQQINQQRTTLSNESSNYYNSLLEMDVPVPPSSNDYTKIVYNFTIGGNKATVNEVLPIEDKPSQYLVTYETTLSTIGVQENTAYKTAAKANATKGNITEVTTPATVTDADSQAYNLATANKLSQAEASSMTATLYKSLDTYAAGAIIFNEHGYQITDAYYAIISGSGATPEQQKEAANCKFYAVASATEKADASISKYALSYAQIPNQATFDQYKSFAQIYKFTADPTGSDIYGYQASNGKAFTVVDPQYNESFINAGLDSSDYYQYEASSGIRFVKREDVENNLNNQSRTITTYAVTTIEVTKENSMNDATIEFDASGRISSITDEQGITYTMTATTETDNVAYDDAYNQYEYNQYVYDQKQNEINANIEILQAQDKSLELRLSTLDTQHSAIQTELEAVKKVMSKNIDNSFKTFNA